MNVVLVSYEMKVNNLLKIIRYLKEMRDKNENSLRLFGSSEEEIENLVNKYNSRIAQSEAELEETLKNKPTNEKS
jgi:hypothetical protein